MRDHPCFPNAKRTWLSVVVLGLVLAFAGSLQAGEDETAPAPQAEVTADAAPAEEVVTETNPTVPSPLRAMTVYRDPQTGQLTHVPPPGAALVLSQALARRVDRSSDGLRSRHLPDGTSLLDLQGRFLQLSVAKVSAEGTVESDCVTNAGKAETFLSPKTTARDDEQEKRDDP